jgi:site-specific DNA-methyltransferase (adenine-specific)
MEFKKVVVWHKQNFGLGYHYRNVIEYVLMFSNGKSGRHITNQPNFFKAPKDDIEGHPTVKPVSMLRWFIENSSAQGGVVLDPFMGSGSTAVAAQQTRRQFVGFEINPKFAEIANQRLKQRMLSLLEV